MHCVLKLQRDCPYKNRPLGENSEVFFCFFACRQYIFKKINILQRKEEENVIKKKHGDQKLIIKIILMIIGVVLVTLFCLSIKAIQNRNLEEVEEQVVTKLGNGTYTGTGGSGSGGSGSSEDTTIVEDTLKPVTNYTIMIDELGTKPNIKTQIMGTDSTGAIKSALVSEGVLTANNAANIDGIVVITGDVSNVKDLVVTVSGYEPGDTIGLVINNGGTYSYVCSGTVNEDGTVNFAVNGNEGTEFAKTSGNQISPNSSSVVIISGDLGLGKADTVGLTLIKGRTYKITALADFCDVTGESTISCSTDCCIYTPTSYLYANKTGKCNIRGTYLQNNKATIQVTVVDENDESVSNGQAYEVTQATSSKAGLYDADGNLVMDWVALQEGGYVTVSGTTLSGGANKTNLSGVLYIDDGIESVGSYAFQNCNKLTGITCPSSLRSIGSWAFAECTGLKEITLNDGLTTISSRAFHITGSTASGVKTVFIPKSVTAIDSYAFSYNYSASAQPIKFYTDAAARPSGWSKDHNNFGSLVCNITRSEYESTYKE